MAAGAGYSGTPLAQKLGLRDGDRVLFIDLPESLAELTTARRFAEASRVTVEQVGDAEGPYAVVHLFTGARAVLERLIGRLRDLIARDGAIWVSWPKQASRIDTDLTEDAIRAAVLPLGLVDVKVCAVDEVWSGLKLVIRKELR